MSEEDASKLAKKMINAEFDFNDFLKQSKMMKSMGDMGSVAKMIPGMAGKISPRELSGVEVRKYIRLVVFVHVCLISRKHSFLVPAAIVCL